LRNRFISATLVSLVVWGLTSCGSTPAVKTEEPVLLEESAPTVSPTPMPKPTETRPGPVGDDFRLYADTPVLEMGAPGSWDSRFMDPGSVVFSDNKFHMFYDGSPSFPGLIKVGYAASADGLTFSRISTESVFSLEDVPWQSKPSNININSVMVDNGIWIMYFAASESLESRIGVIGRATAPSPSGPWTVDPEPVLRPGDSSAWDAAGIGHVEVLQSGEGYVLYYSSIFGIGMATSADGIAWEKYNNPATNQPAFAASDPIMAKSGAEDPNVQKTPWGWAMVYRYKFSLYFAESEDGLHWKDAHANPIITFVDKSINYSSLLVKEDTAFLYFEAGNTSTSIYEATWNLTAPQEGV
jgi:predicted GH43/DUF377 family glycosyl hydrolase